MKHPYQDFISQVEKPGRYLGGEYQSMVKDWDRTPIRIALTFPDLYEIGMSHMGMKILYSLLNQQEDILVERAYTPWFDMEKELRARRLPIYSLENIKPLKEFDILGFSLQYEMTYTNVLNMLDLSGIPIRAEERDLSYPLIIAGGPCAMNPEPMARFIDAFVIGDGEEIFPKLARTWVNLRNQGLEKTKILIELAKLGGIYCPALYSTREEELTGLTVVDAPLYAEVPAQIQRNIIMDINAYPYPDDSPVPLTEAVFDRTTMEIARGCTEGCRFCQAGIIYRPVRERDPEQIISRVLSSIDKAGYDESSLTSLSTADFSCVSPLVRNLMEKLKQKRVSLSVSSLRAYGLSGDLLDEIADVRNTSLTFAPEAGTQRMRDVINKNITEEDIAQSAHNIFSRGWRKMKLYFMIGLPTETDADVSGIAETAARMLDIAKKYYKNWKMVNVTASISSFVPKPHTPFQWCQMMDLPEIQRKQSLLMGLAKKYQIGLKWHESLISHIEGVISRGDRKIGEVIERAWRKGARLDGWGNQLRFEYWMDALEEAGLNKYNYLRTLPLDATLPWGHIHVGVEPSFLVQEYKRALKDRLSPPCGKPFRAKVHHTNLQDHEADQRKLICYSCGIACDMQQMRDERGEYLRILGATERYQGLETPAEGQVRAPRLEKFDQPDPHTYRATYTKLKRAQFVSHSDLIRSLPRIIRRAGLQAYYSQGYHPKPVMVFAPALSLGVPSFGEMLDFQLVEDLPEQEIRARLNAVVPEGLYFTRIEKVTDGNKDLVRCINGATYLVALKRETLAGLMQVQDSELLTVLEQRISALLNSETLPVARTRRDRTREVDIRPLLSRLEQVPAESLAAWLQALDWDPAQIFLRMDLQIAGTDSLKPEEILKSLFGHDDFFYETARLSLQPFVAERPASLAGV